MVLLLWINSGACSCRSLWNCIFWKKTSNLGERWERLVPEPPEAEFIRTSFTASWLSHSSLSLLSELASSSCRFFGRLGIAGRSRALLGGCRCQVLCEGGGLVCSVPFCFLLSHGWSPSAKMPACLENRILPLFIWLSEWIPKAAIAGDHSSRKFRVAFLKEQSGDHVPCICLCFASCLTYELDKHNASAAA